MFHKIFGDATQKILFRVLYSRMEILPKVDKAEPHWNDERSDVKPLQRRIIVQSWSPGGGSWAAGEGGSVVGTCGVSLLG